MCIYIVLHEDEGIKKRNFREYDIELYSTQIPS